MLERCGVEDHVRAVLCKHRGQGLDVADVADHRVATVEHGATHQGELDLVEARLVAVQHDERAGLEAVDLAAELRADRATRSGDEDTLALKVASDGLDLEVDAPPAEKLLLSDWLDVLRPHRTVEEACQPGDALHFEASGACEVAQLP